MPACASACRSEFFAEGLNSEVAAAVEAAVTELKKLGATTVEISLANSKLAIPVYYVLAPAEASSNLSRFDGVRYGYRAPEYANLDDMYCKTRAQGFGAEVKRRIMIGAYVLSHGYYDAYYLQAQKIRRLIADDFSAAFKTCDVILGPTNLPSGITITWAGTTPARVLAVSGDLTLDNVTITGGHSVAENISASNPQPAVDARARRRRRRVGRGAPVELPAARQPRRGRFRFVARPRRVRRRGVRRHRAHGALRREWQLRPGRGSGRRRRVLGGRRGELQVGLEHRAFQRQRQRDPRPVRLRRRRIFRRRRHRQPQDAARD